MLVALVTAVLGTLTLSASALAASTTRIVVQDNPGTSSATATSIVSAVGGHTVEQLSLPRTRVITVPTSDASTALAQLNNNPHVNYAQTDATVTAADYGPTVVGTPGHAFTLGASGARASADMIFSSGLSAASDSLATDSANMPPAETPNDPYFIGQNYLNTIDATQAWHIADGQGITVGVVDTGTDLQHLRI